MVEFKIWKGVSIMCLGITLKIISINDTEAIGELNGVRNKIRIDLLPNAKVGDFVMVHAGFGIEIIDESRAKENIETLMELEKLASTDSDYLEDNGGK